MNRGEHGGLPGFRSPWRMDAGFTLLELMMAMTLLALITVIASGALRLAIGSWEKGERMIEGGQQLRIVLDLMKHQIQSASPADTGRNGAPPPVFDGDGKTLFFKALVSVDPENVLGSVYVKYEVETPVANTEKLLFSEKNVVFTESPADKDSVDLGTSHELIPEIFSFSFAYADRPGSDGIPDWQETWESRKKKRLPVAVKIMAQSKEDMPVASVVARIPAAAAEK